MNYFSKFLIILFFIAFIFVGVLTQNGSIYLNEINGEYMLISKIYGIEYRKEYFSDEASKFLKFELGLVANEFKFTSTHEEMFLTKFQAVSQGERHKMACLYLEIIKQNPAISDFERGRLKIYMQNGDMDEFYNYIKLNHGY